MIKNNSQRSFDEAQTVVPALQEVLIVHPDNSHGKNKLITYRYIAYAIVNGTLYLAIAIKGGSDLEKLLSLNSLGFIISVSACNSVVYTMFTYKTLEFLSLNPNSLTKLFFSILAPFTASAFLTAGTAGAEVLKFNSQGALIIGSLLFVLRIVNCVDASVKFPQRFIDTYQAWIDAQRTKDCNEIARLFIVWISSIGYAASTTDAIYNSTLTISSWLSISSPKASPFFYLASILGALSALPLTVYWSHRGLRQLTFGGKINENGQTSDPTDRYTYLGLICVLPSILGILGGATASTGHVFAQLGNFAIYTRLITSIFYALCAGTPGMATLLRVIGPQINCKLPLVFKKSTNLEAKTLLSQSENTFFHYHEKNGKDKKSTLGLTLTL